MPSSRTPNKSRFLEAATIYRDAMVPFIDGVLGSDRIQEQLFNDEARKRNEGKYEEGMRSLLQGTPARNLIDHADIPFLIRDDLPHFSGLDGADVNRMHEIRLLWNEKIKHLSDFGDFAPEDAAEYATHCARVLRRCGLDADADAIIGTSSSEATEAPAASASDLREQRERREWDKARLAGKPSEDLTPWEQQRLGEIEWEEEWERRELVRSEREEIAGFGDDIDGLRSWFEADKARHDRHTSEHAALQQREQERREQREREQRKREREERERREQHERERRKREREERERQRERTEIAAFGADFDGLRRWFDTDKVRPTRHASEYKALLRWEHERLEIAVFAANIDALRRWFVANTRRVQRHPSEYADLVRRERELELREHELRERERAEIAAFGNDIDGLRRWLDADKDRQSRHPSEHAALLQREHERAELEAREAAEREHERAELEAREAAEREHELRDRERAEIAAFGNDIDGLRRWFDYNRTRRTRHLSKYEELERRERHWPRQLRMRLLATVRSIAAAARDSQPRSRTRLLAAARSEVVFVHDLFTRPLVLKASAILAFSFVLICVLIGVRYGWWLEFAAVTWSATLPGLAFAVRASYCFRIANEGGVEEKGGHEWAFLKESLVILAVSVLLIYVLVGAWGGWWPDFGFLMELGAATVPGLLLAGYVGYRSHTTNDAAVKVGRSPALLSTALFYLLMAVGVLVLIPVAIVLWMIFSDD